MTLEEFDKTKFYVDTKVKISGKWYGIESCDFEYKTVTLDFEKLKKKTDKIVVVPYFLIEEIK